MGLCASVEARMQELEQRLIPAAQQRLRDLQLAAAAEKTAGIPPSPGSKQALEAAAGQHRLLLSDELGALTDRLIALRSGRLFRAPKMPDPTAPWEEVEAKQRQSPAAETASETAAEPSTPAGSSSSPVRRRLGSSNDDAELAGDVHSEAEQLLPDRAGPAGLSAPGLRLRPGH